MVAAIGCAIETADLTMGGAVNAKRGNSAKLRQLSNPLLQKGDKSTYIELSCTY